MSSYIRRKDSVFEDIIFRGIYSSEEKHLFCQLEVCRAISHIHPLNLFSFSNDPHNVAPFKNSSGIRI